MLVQKSVVVLGSLILGFSALAQSSYQSDVDAWRARAENSLRRDNGWLSLAGRWPLREASTTVGTASDNQIVFPKGVSPAQFGRLEILGQDVFINLAPGLSIIHENRTESGRVKLATNPNKQEWWQAGRLSFTVFAHPVSKAFILRIADQENEVRKNFTGRKWFAIDEKMKVKARFVATTGDERVSIVNVLGEVSNEKIAGRFEFSLAGKKHSLMALGEEKDEDLFIILSDYTSGKSTYGSGRFLSAKRPSSAEAGELDLNKIYNPPCAFSAFTSCPLPPLENQLKISLAVGERI